MEKFAAKVTADWRDSERKKKDFYGLNDSATITGREDEAN